ncbi:bis(5'-nucleosyl)-tetraphosphatase (symmetrical) YqeK [Bacillus shivajii]|uniref:bis(5'-nucleosyl)-tetraphosphatase (symmetrical) YqeK n=1 Tax=Bacillus shivajii TaxID=1983719 RepID=UPI001CFA8CC3|nr:bis(5'-nucleosyl)-tetraphosphatase (symmetrical) YqeK [Bacillus shivajii]UCZ54462.1 bis(5'-nucleosyl)-tetraphosphatase (symmetrical) YqeK [Bacillus shivajii]
MNEIEALEAVKHALKTRRYEHTLRVTDEAETLARKYGANIKEARLAAILHDYAKYRPTEEMRRSIQMEKSLPNQLLDYGNEILHAFVGALYVKKELQIEDENILLAITYHTTGRKEMTLLEKIIFIADYIEPGRTFPGVEEVRTVAEKDLDKACFYALRNTIQFLVKKEQPVYPDTFEAYNYFANK